MLERGPDSPGQQQHREVKFPRHRHSRSPFEITPGPTPPRSRPHLEHVPTSSQDLGDPKNSLPASEPIKEREEK